MKEKLPKRKKLRLKYYDYTEEGMYFITICTKNKQQLLGKIVDENTIKLTKEGKIAEKNIYEIEKIFDNVVIDDYVVMPNHIHMIIMVEKNSNVHISRIIQQYKMSVSKIIGRSIWQKSYYDHVITKENEYYMVKQYVQNNIINWMYDKYY